MAVTNVTETVAMGGINGNIGVGCRVFEFPLNIMEADHPVQAVQLFSEVQGK